MLTIPPLLAGAALLFWGWQTGFFLFATLMALVLEASRLTDIRWDLSQRDYNRIWNLGAVLFAGVAVYCFASTEGADSLVGAFGSRASRTAALAQTTRSIVVFFQWLPVIFFPIMLAQAYGSRDKIDLSTFSWIVRRRLAFRANAQEPPPGLNVSFVYFGICLFAASAQKTANAWFVPALGLLIALALFTQRPGHHGIFAWTSTMLVTLVLAFGAQLGLRELHRGFERLDSLLLSRFSARAVDASEARTALGAVGKLSLSGRIVIRLRSDDQAFPGYLREASYNVFRSPYWAATRPDFGNLLAETNETTWILLAHPTPTRTVHIAQFLGRNRRLLAAPTGVSVMEELPVFQLETNRFGALKAEAGPGFVDYLSRYDPDRTIDGRPDEDDLRIPESEERTLSEVADRLGLYPGIEPAEALQKTARYFDENFAYSSYLPGEPPKGETPLGRFLLRKHSGHCELFGTATTLLLRKAGIPTRYAVGYSVQESKGSAAVVRERHAHAWCLAHVNGVWRDVDTTPASWAALEGSRASWWQPVSDAWSQAWFGFSKWRYGKSSLRPYIPWIIAPLAILLVAQLLWRKSGSRTGKVSTPGRRLRPGSESEFYEVERLLSHRGFVRHSHETLLQWAERIRPLIAGASDALLPLIRFHYRLRFDPQGLASAERKKLREAVADWSQKWLEAEPSQSNTDLSCRRKSPGSATA